MVVGSIPTEPRTFDVSDSDFDLREMLEVLLGAEGKRKIRLRRKTNEELFQLYGAQLALRHRSQDALEEAQRVLGHLGEFLGEYPPSPELAESFLAQFAKHKPTTLYRYHSIVKTFMRWYGEDLQSHIKLPDTLPDYVEPDDITKLKEAMQSKKTHKRVIERNVLIIDVIAKTGLRRGELSALRVRDIDFVRRHLVVRQGKGMKDRIVELTASLIEPLRIQVQGKSPDDSVFGLRASTVSGIVRWAAQRANVDIHTHSLRHFFGQSLVDTGTDLEVVRRLMGHSKLSTTQQYLGRTDKQRRDAIDRLEENHVAAPGEHNNDVSGGATDTVIKPSSCFVTDENGHCRGAGLRSDCEPCYYLRIGRTQEEIDRLVSWSLNLPAKVQQAKESFAKRLRGESS